jgi:putative CocE/NonD family hydrolase
MRQPYGRRIASTVVYAHPAWFASKGYIVAIQDVRGRGSSSGRFQTLIGEDEDGAASLEWAAGLSGSTGQVAMYGFSYQGIVQYQAMAGAKKAGTKRPDAIAPAMAAWSVRDDWVYEGGAFNLSGQLGWGIQMAAEQARLAGDAEAFEALATRGRGTPWAGSDPVLPAEMRRYGHYCHYADWLADRPGTWRRIAPAHLLENDPLDVPGLHIGGWLDLMLEGTLAAYKAFNAISPSAQRLIIGPWLHIPWGRQVGVLDLGPDAASPIDTELVKFFDLHLKDAGEAGAPVRLFDIGTKSWEDFASFPAPELESFFLGSNGLAATTSNDGTLESEPGVGRRDFLVHDPWRPAPALGGHNGQPAGFQDRRAIDDRTDVVVYTSAPLPCTVKLAGRVAVEIYCECDRPSHDLNCTLSIIGPDQRVITLTSGHLRIVGESTSAMRRVGMRATYCTISAGSQLRLSIQAAAWPAFAINPGTGKRPEDSGALEAQVTTLVINLGGTRPSRVLLPIY